jgi:hypothetical protein
MNCQSFLSFELLFATLDGTNQFLLLFMSEQMTLEIVAFVEPEKSFYFLFTTDPAVFR